MTGYQELRDLVEMPETGKVCIYGAGGFGKQLKSFIDARRPQLELVCFADTYRKEPFEELEVLSPEDLIQRKELDYIFIASMYWEEIISALPEMENVIVIHAVVGDIFLPVPGSDHPLGLDPQSQMSLDRVRNLLHTETDRQLWDKLVKIRCCFPEPLKAWAADHSENFPNQYLDYLKFHKMRIAVEGGVFDGSTALSFLERMAKDARLIGFDPFPAIYDEGNFKDVLARRFPGAVRMEALALWNKNQVLRFQQDTQDATASGGTSHVVENNAEQAETCRVQGIILDEYVGEKGLPSVDFIKMDIEGSEIEALEGARETIVKHRPQMAICIYHKKEHMYQIPLLINDWVKNYRFHLGHYSDSFWETVFYAIPEEIAATD